MRWSEKVSELYQSQCERYPGLQIGDLLKASYQSVYGCGHLIESPSAAADYIREEAAKANPVNNSQIEPLGEEFCRVHLDYLKTSGLKPDTLAKLFALSAQKIAGNERELIEMLEVLLAMAKACWIPFRYEEVLEEVNQWQQEGFPPKHHTEQFRSTYTPSYRVLCRDYAWALPVFAAIDRAMEEKQRLLVAIEGGAASGKSTLGELLKRVYNCNLFHMDDFFLRPEQRTPQRYGQPGGNVDYERFCEEVMKPLTKGENVQYRRFDCGTFQIQPPIEVKPTALNIIEGSYSCHPHLEKNYDFKVFLKIAPELQARRIRKRNDPACQVRFFEQWIPMERTYFEKMEIAQTCDLILEVVE